MGRRGPAPKPTALKKAAGNPGKRQLNDGEPVPPAGLIEPPDWLGESGRAIWDQLAPTMVVMQTLTTADVLPFARYCELFARWLELRELMWKNKSVYPVKDQKGQVRYVAEHPWSVELRRLTAQLLQLEREFGLTPSARSRIQVMPTATQKQTSDGDAAGSVDRSAAIRSFFTGGGPAKPKVVG